MQSASYSIKLLSQIAKHLEDFTKTLPRCNNYVAIFPHHPRLHNALRDIYKTYVDVCVDTANYLERKPAGILLTVTKLAFRC